MQRFVLITVSFALLAAAVTVAEPSGQRIPRGAAHSASHERVLAGSSAASLTATSDSTRAARRDAARRELSLADGALAVHAVHRPSPARNNRADRPSAGKPCRDVFPAFSSTSLTERVIHAARIPRRSTFQPADDRSVLIERTNIQRQRLPATLLAPSRPPAHLLQSSAPLAVGRWWTYLFDNFEGAFPNYWMLQGTPTWGITSFRASTGSRSIWCAASHYSAPGPYLNNMNGWIVDGPFNLRNTSSVELYFDYYVDSQPVADAVFIGASTDGLNFTGNAYSGFSAGWVRDAKVILNQFAGAPNLYIGIQFYSDHAIVGEGAYVDNIELAGYIPSSASVDMAVRNPYITDPVEEIFQFDVHNYGPGTAAANSYTIDVFVDGVLDSSARNSSALAPGATVTWEWQLAYIYAPGPHTIRVELRPDGGDIAPADNALSFVMTVVAPTPVDLSPRNVAIISPANGTFDFEVYNAGPGIARAASYRVRVFVDGRLDSEARNQLALGAGESATWQWQLDYYYQAGPHTIRIDVLSDISDANPNNNSISFSWTVPQPSIITDLQVRRLKLKDAINDVFSFQVVNNGPAPCRPGDYEVRVYVDGFLDGLQTNANHLYVGWIADWTWQLNYLYPPGLHVVTIEAWPLGADLTPRDNSQSVSLLKPGQNLTVQPVATVTAVVNVAVSALLSATNGAPPYTWRISSGSLPAGLYLAGNGVFSGVPSSAGSFTATAEARDAAGLTAFTPLNVLVLNSTSSLPLSVLVRTLPPAFVNVSYSVQFQAAGGSPPYQWSPVSGFPPGTSLSTAGVLSGTPTLAGYFSVNVLLSDSSSASTTATLSLPVLPASKYLSAGIRKCSVKIPWAKHDQGLRASDTLSFRAACDLPIDFVLDKYSRLVLWIGDYALSFNTPRQATWQRTATFTTSDASGMKATATVRRSGQRLRITVSLRRANLAAALASYGVSKTGPNAVIVPIRLALNGTDTGQRSIQMTYSLKGTNGQLKL